MWAKESNIVLLLIVHIDPYIVEHIGDNLGRIWTSLTAQLGKEQD